MHIWLLLFTLHMCMLGSVALVGAMEECMASSSANAPRWDYHSGVTHCPECGGEGGQWNGRGRGGNDPDSWLIDCPECEGAGIQPCPVCGYQYITPGVDCPACATVADLPDQHLADTYADALVGAVRKAISARRAFACPA